MPENPEETDIRQLIGAREKCHELDCKILDTVLVPVDELSPLLRTDTPEPGKS